MAGTHEGEQGVGANEGDSEFARLEELYGELNEAGYFAHEFMWTKDKYGAAVGTLDDLAQYLGVDNPDDITDEMMDNLPPFIMFAAPGGGTSRVAAVENAYAQMLEIEEDRCNKEREQGETTMSAHTALFSAEEGIVRIVRADSIVSGRMVPTGETVLETYTYGSKTMSFNREVTELYIEREITETPPEPRKVSTEKAAKRRGISDNEFKRFEYPGFKDWLDELDTSAVSSDDMRAWAETTILSAEDYERKVPCYNCKGKGEFAGLSCWCKEANSITDMMTGDTAYDKDDKSPDPDCEQCGGTGEYTSSCPICDGAKEQLMYPALELYDPATEQTRTIPFDLAAMIREYPEGLYEENWAREVSEYGYAAATRILNFDLAAYLKKDNAALDDEMRLYAKHGDEDYIFDFDQSFRSVEIQRVDWRSKTGKGIYRRSNTEKEALSKDEVIEGAQEQLARTLSVRADIDKSRKYELYYAPSADVRLADLRGLVAHYGYGIGSALEGYETGTRAYTLYLVDDENNFISHLGQSYDSDDTIEQAWRAVQKLIAAGHGEVI